MHHNNSELKELLQLIADSIVNGNVSININVYEDGDNIPKDAQDAPARAKQITPDADTILKCQMSARYLGEYLEETHPVLFDGVVGSLHLSPCGEGQFTLTPRGFDYYQQHKEELFEACKYKAGLTKLYFDVKGINESYIQIDKDTIIKNVGQFLPFGVSALMHNEDQYDEDQYDEELEEQLQRIMQETDDRVSLNDPAEPLVSMKEFYEHLPTAFRDLQLTLNDVAGIVTVLYQRSAASLLDELNEFKDGKQQDSKH